MEYKIDQMSDALTALHTILTRFMDVIAAYSLLSWSACFHDTMNDFSSDAVISSQCDFLQCIHSLIEPYVHMDSGMMTLKLLNGNVVKPDFKLLDIMVIIKKNPEWSCIWRAIL